MSEARIGGGPSAATLHGGAVAVALRGADGLSLAAAPACAIMALLAARGGSPADLLCSAARGTSILDGMVPMYVLMSALHARPWIRLVARWAGGRGRP